MNEWTNNRKNVSSDDDDDDDDDYDDEEEEEEEGDSDNDDGLDDDFNCDGALTIHEGVTSSREGGRVKIGLSAGCSGIDISSLHWDLNKVHF